MKSDHPDQTARVNEQLNWVELTCNTSLSANTLWKPAVTYLITIQNTEADYRGVYFDLTQNSVEPSQILNFKVVDITFNVTVISIGFVTKRILAAPWWSVPQCCRLLSPCPPQTSSCWPPAGRSSTAGSRCTTPGSQRTRRGTRRRRSAPRSPSPTTVRPADSMTSCHRMTAFIRLCLFGVSEKFQYKSTA